MEVEENDISQVIDAVLQLKLDEGYNVRSLFKKRVEDIKSKIKEVPWITLSILDVYKIYFGFEQYQKRKNLRRPMARLNDFKIDDDLTTFCYIVIPKGFRLFYDINKQISWLIV